jgi:hypothetical protein
MMRPQTQRSAARCVFCRLLPEHVQTLFSKDLIIKGIVNLRFNGKGKKKKEKSQHQGLILGQGPDFFST